MLLQKNFQTQKHVALPNEDDLRAIFVYCDPGVHKCIKRRLNIKIQYKKKLFFCTSASSAACCVTTCLQFRLLCKLNQPHHGITETSSHCSALRPLILLCQVMYSRLLSGPSNFSTYGGDVNLELRNGVLYRVNVVLVAVVAGLPLIYKLPQVSAG